MAPRKGVGRNKVLKLPSSRWVSPLQQPQPLVPDDEFQSSIFASRRRTRSLSCRMESGIMKQNPASTTRRSSGTERAARDDIQKRNRKTESPRVSSDDVTKRGAEAGVNSAEEDGGVEQGNEKELVVRSRCSPKRIMELVSYETTSAMKIGALDSIGFGGTFRVQIGSLSALFNRWAVEAYDVGTRSFFFFEGDALTVTEENVQRVYAIPRGNRSVCVTAAVCAAVKCRKRYG